MSAGWQDEWDDFEYPEDILEDWDALPEEPGFQMDPIPISKEFVKMLESHYPLLVDHYMSIGPVCDMKDRRVTHIKKVTSVMRKRDHDVVTEMLRHLDPKLMDVARAMFVPSGIAGLHDYTDESNQLRRAFLKCYEPGMQVALNYNPSLVYQKPNLYRGGEIVVSSDDPIDHLDFVANTYPAALWEICLQLRESPGVSLNTGDVEGLLRSYRAGRRLSKSLNRFSKINELVAVDYDNPFFWFDGLDDCDDEAIVLAGDMPTAVLSRYHRSFYDPGLQSRHKDKVIFVNLAQGDESGCYSNRSDLIASLYLNTEDCVIFVHGVPTKFVPFPLILRKPRPHNLTAVWRLGSSDPHGKPVYLDGIRSANIRRNERYMGKTSVCLLPICGGVDYIVSRAGKALTAPAYPTKERTIKKKKSRHMAERDSILLWYSRDPNYNPKSGHFMKLGGKARRGPLLVDIPAFGSAELVFDSLWKRALDDKMRVVFRHGVWYLE